jgi:hypothetical protein
MYCRAQLMSENCEPLCIVQCIQGEWRMPDTSETADLEAQIEALISKASTRLRQQLEDVRRNTESGHDQLQNVVIEAS